MSAGEGFVFRKKFGKQRIRFFHCKVELIFVVDEVRLIHIGTDGNRVCKV